MKQQGTRRHFLRQGAMAAAAGVYLASQAKAEASQPLGVQLYSVRNQVIRDLPGTLRQIRAIGYQQVETLPSLYTHPAAELKAIIHGEGLAVPSGHFDYESFPKSISYARQLGLTYMVCPKLPEARWNAAGFHQAAKDYSEWGRQAADQGMHLAFHSLNYEFKPLGATSGFQILIENTDPKLVGLEMDCYWVAEAGRDPLQLLRKYSDRMHLLHFKDRIAAAAGFSPDDPPHFTEMGQGTIDHKAIIREAQAQGIRYYFMDQDESKLPPIASLRLSYKYLRTLIA